MVAVKPLTDAPSAWPDARPVLEHALADFAPTGLAAAEAVALQDRVDTKFVLSTGQLVAALPALAGSYQVLDIAGVRAGRYRTLYFDTPALNLYLDHHNGKINRHKVRSRLYLETGQAFLEVKRKGWNRTQKRRTETASLLTCLSDDVAEFLASEAPPCRTLEALTPSLWNTFRRITLVSRDRPERVTIDLDLTWWQAGTVASGEAALPEPESSAGNQGFALPGVVVAEMKQAGIKQASAFAAAMREAGVRPGRFSKYCVGIASLYPIKSNNFKTVLTRAERMVEEPADVD